MHLFTFPYWCIIDREGVNRVLSISIGNREFKFYPPYRTSPANEVFSPQPNKVLFLHGLMPVNASYEIPKVSVYPLFNEDGIGISAFQAETHESWSPKRRNRKDMPVDTIRVDVFSEDNYEPTVELKRLMDILRVKSNQWWIGQLPYSLDYISVSQEVDVNGNPTESLPVVNSPLVFVSVFQEKVIDIKLWSSALSDLGKNIDPKIYSIALLDAMYATSKQDNRRIVLDLARALDTAVDTHFYRIWTKNKMGTSGNYSRKAFMKGVPPKAGDAYNSSTSIPLLISHITQNILGQSFEESYPSEFLTLQEFWEKKRNPVSHGGSIHITTSEAHNYIQATARCIDWLESFN